MWDNTVIYSVTEQLLKYSTSYNELTAVSVMNKYINKWNCSFDAL